MKFIISQILFVLLFLTISCGEFDDTHETGVLTITNSTSGTLTIYTANETTDSGGDLTAEQVTTSLASGTTGTVTIQKDIFTSGEFSAKLGTTYKTFDVSFTDSAASATLYDSDF